MTWTKEELSNYNHAKSPWFIVSTNGKVDIGNERGDGDSKIGLQPWGMYKLVHEWLKCNHELSKEQKLELINLLQK
ncbi:hypothetical protein NDK43_09395 [Neobacillus pocheonensis]|uniref:Uncharacterized protein n=1 Tax=Neobacillus pocheonensis TaxID=363869 RepID=A0ABT0W8A2_9BACI|nr:hypothetical protein [Neobacillus pocheonensis]